VRDALRLAFGTLTILPVQPPERVDPRTAGRAMVLAPVVGLVLAAAAVVALRLLDAVSPLLASVLVVALLAVLTRAIHLDGLADTADGLGSGRSGAQALAVMRRSDIGPFGVLTLVLALVTQVAALADLVSRGTAAEALTVAVVVSRLVIPLLCTPRLPAARADGLGSVVAGSVRGPGVVVAVLLAGVAVALAATVLAAADRGPDVGPAVFLAALTVPLLVAGMLCRRCVRRFGGLTGDVLGACVETAFTTALVVACL
jgi:adenosylcobinamide-GDP ribazoletransferase